MPTEPSPAKPAPIIGSVTWGVGRKRQGPTQYSSDELHAEVVVLVPEGVRSEEAFALAKAIVKRELGPDLDSGPRVEEPMPGATPPASREGPGSFRPAQESPSASKAPAAQGGAAKPCKYCGRPIKWGKRDDGSPLPLNPDGSKHACNRGGPR